MVTNYDRLYTVKVTYRIADCSYEIMTSTLLQNSRRRLKERKEKEKKR
jgi:hypothetical protein